MLLLVGLAPLMLGRWAGKRWYLLGLLVVYPIVAAKLFGAAWPGWSRSTPNLWGGLFLTLLISIVGIVASFPLGIVLALGRRSDLPIIRGLCVGFIEIIRGVPLVTVLFMASVMLPLFLPAGLDDRQAAARAGRRRICSPRAYLAEVIRGGLQAIPKGQFEAADGAGPRLLAEDGADHPAAGAAARDSAASSTASSRCSRTPRWSSSSASSTCSAWRRLIGSAIRTGSATTSRPTSSRRFGFWIFCFAMSRYSQ